MHNWIFCFDIYFGCLPQNHCTVVVVPVVKAVADVKFTKERGSQVEMISIKRQEYIIFLWWINSTYGMYKVVLVAELRVFGPGTRPTTQQWSRLGLKIPLISFGVFCRNLYIA